MQKNLRLAEMATEDNDDDGNNDGSRGRYEPMDQEDVGGEDGTIVMVVRGMMDAGRCWMTDDVVGLWVTGEVWRVDSEIAGYDTKIGITIMTAMHD